MSKHRTRKLDNPPRGRLRKKSNAARERALQALAAMRRGVTLSRAARETGVTPRTIRRYAGSALLQDRPGGRIRARKTARLLRYLQIPGPDGPRDITGRGTKAAGDFATYTAAIKPSLRGDRHALARWR